MPRRRWHQQPREPCPPFKLGSKAPRNWWCHLMTEQWKSSAEPNSTPLIDVTGGAICPFRNDDHATISVRSMWIDENWQYCSWLCKLSRALHDTCCKNLMFTWCKPALFEDQKCMFGHWLEPWCRPYLHRITPTVSFFHGVKCTLSLRIQSSMHVSQSFKTLQPLKSSGYSKLHQSQKKKKAAWLAIRQCLLW